jgi:cysteine synthase A
VNAPQNVLAAIGNTPLAELRRVVPPDHARVLVKLEGHNPAGSAKDRMALAHAHRLCIIHRDLRRGRCTIVLAARF